MADGALSGPVDYNRLFNQAILANLEYLQRLPAVAALDAARLDEERESLLRCIHFGLHLNQAWPLVCRLIETVSPYMERRGYWAVWEQVLRRACETAVRQADLATAVPFSLLLARLLQSQFRTEETTRQYRQTMRLARHGGDDYNLARAYTNLGYLYVEQGRWLRAEVLCRHALTIFERLGNLHGLAHTENHLGMLYMRLGQWGEEQTILSRARPHLQKACEYWQANQDEYGLVYGYSNLGMYYLLSEQPDEALRYSGQALEYAQRVGEKTRVGSIWVNIGLAYELKKDYPQAQAYYHQAEKTFKQYFNAFELANVQKNLGCIYWAQGQWPAAIDYFNVSLTYWQAVGNGYHLAETLIYLAKCELARGDVDTAEEWLSQAESLTAQLPQSSRRVIAELRETRHSLSQKSVAGREKTPLAAGVSISSARLRDGEN